MTTRIGYYPSFIALKTLTKREIMRFMRIWSQTLLPPAITMGLYFIIFGKFIGSQLRHIDGHPYIQYIAPGLILMSIMTNAYSNTSSSFFLTKFNKSIEEMLVSPMSSLTILLGFIFGGTVRGLLVGAMVTLVSLLFTSIPLTHVSIIFGMAFLAAVVFSLGGLINGIYAKNFDDIAFIPTFVLTPLTYLGGVFYSIKQLPETWRFVSMFNPILDMVDAFRFGFLGTSDLPVFWGFTLVTLLAISLFFWALHLLTKGVGIKV